MITRRGFIGGLIAAPAIVRASSLMALSRAQIEPEIVSKISLYTGVAVQWGDLIRVTDVADMTMIEHAVRQHSLAS